MVKMFSEGARARHVCASDANGVCAACVRFGLFGPITARLARGANGATVTVERPGALTSAQRSTGHKLARAERQRLKREAEREASERAEREAREAREREASRKAETARREAERASEGKARREAKRAEREAKRQAERVAAQAELIALRVSHGAEWTVGVKFARGAHAVEVFRADSLPHGWQESRAARKVRGDAPGLRFVEAERVRDNIARKFGASRAERRRA